MDPLQLIYLGLIVTAAFCSGLCLIWGIFNTLLGQRLWIKERLAGPREPTLIPGDPSSVEILRDRRMSRIHRLNRLLRTSPFADSTALELAQAHVPLKVGEYLLLRSLCALVVGYILMSLGGNWLAIVPGALIGYFAPRVYVGHRRSSRIHALEGQLVDALSLSANSLRAGWGFMQAMSQVAQEMPAPISEEFTQVLQEVNIGTPPDIAVQHMLQRVPSYELELVMTSVLIQRQIGGNLAEMIDNIAFTVRERTRLLGDIASITAESRLSMWLLSLLPVALLVFLAVAQPDYMLPFLTDPRGRILLVSAGVMEVLGVVMMKRLAQVDV